MAQLCIHSQENMAPLDILWQSTGFTPATLLHTQPMRQSMIRNGAIPHRGMRYVRIHYLLDLIRGEGFGSTAVVYDWRDLDRGLDLLVENKLAPFFELMGNPCQWWQDFEDPLQVHAWRRLVRDLAQHCIERYGAEEIRSWYFETWNEPDLGWWKWGDQGFLNYYDACSEGLREVDPRIRFGGPGTAEPRSQRFRSLMAHCDQGINYFTGEQGVRIDFISIHEKGGPFCMELVSPSTARIMDETKADWAWLEEHHPRLCDRPYINNECDPLVGWKDRQTWRAWPYHASFAVNLIIEHLAWQDAGGPQVALLGNDHGFLGEFGKRTQFSLFGEEKDWPQGHFEMFKKPVFNVFTALSLLGDQRLCISEKDLPSGLRVLPTCCSDDQSIAIAVCYHQDSVRAQGRAGLTLQVVDLQDGPWILAQWAVSEDYPHPFSVWEESGHLAFPEKGWSLDEWTMNRGDEVYAQMRKVEELAMVGTPRSITAQEAAAGIELDMAMHSVHLLLLVRPPKDPPQAIESLTMTRWPGRCGGEQILLRWPTLEARNIQGYEVQYRASADQDWETICDAETLDGAWRHRHSHRPAQGSYRVRARDLSQQRGPWSPQLDLPDLIHA